MRENLPWLSQGDIFREVPVLDVTLGDRSRVDVTVLQGPAVLLTHDCALDKKSNSGVLQLARMQFASIRTIDSLPRDKAGNLRAGAANLKPFDAMHIGNIPPFGESWFSLTDPYFLPAGLFEPELRLFSDHPASDGTEPHVCAAINDTRAGRLEESEILLLRAKMTAFWTRQQQRDQA